MEVGGGGGWKETLSSCCGSSGLEEAVAKLNLLFYSFVSQVTSKLLLLYW